MNTTAETGSAGAGVSPQTASPVTPTSFSPIPPTAPTPVGSVPPVMPVTSPMVAVRGLTKYFGSMCAVAQLNLDIPRGSMYGFVGPNGAGKTTTLSMVTGLLKPDAGQVWVSDLDVWAEPRLVKAKIGTLPDRLRLFDRLSGQELLTYTGLLRGMDRATIAQRSKDLLDALGLADDARKTVADYSAGMTKKIGLACAVLHAPDLLVLDEPFEAIDPVSARSIAEILGGFVSDGGTVILSSHVMDTVQRLCDHVAIIAHGQLLAAGRVDEVAAGVDLETRFIQMVGGGQVHEELTWLRPSSV
jgi:ABC-2 type transport system ATP-binding protein